MRQSTIALWFATLISLFLPVLACRQRFYIFHKEYSNCNEALTTGVQQHMAQECNSIGGGFKTLNAQPAMQSIFGRDITYGLNSTVTLPNDNANCIAWVCIVTAWRYHEWQTNMEHKALPGYSGWKYIQGYFGQKVNC